MNLMKDVLSTSMGLPVRSNNCSMKWKKLDFRKFGGGCFVNSILPTWQLKKNARRNFRVLENKKRTQIIQTRSRIFTVHCIAYFYTGVIFGCKPNKIWVPAMPSHHLCLTFIRKKKNGFGIVYCFYYYQTFKDWSPWKGGWLTRRARDGSTYMIVRLS